MGKFLGFAIPAVPYGCTYAVVAVALVLTYQATGVFNFAFAAQAYISSLVYVALVQSAHWPAWLAFMVSVLILAPGLGLVFNHFLFSRIPSTNNMAKLVTSISLLVGLPFLVGVILPGNYYTPPGIVLSTTQVYFHLGSQPINGLEISTVVLTALLLLGLVVMMRFTNLGLQMRGAVESRRLVQLDGVNAGRVVSVAWAVSSLLAGLAGVMLAPNFPGQVAAENYLVLMVAAIAAAACAAFRSMPRAAIAAVLIGLATFTLQGYLPTTSFLFTAILPALPFIVLVGALLFVPGMRDLDNATDPLSGVDPPPPPTVASTRAPSMDRVIRTLWYVLLGAFIVSMLTWMPKDWENVFNEGLALSTLFLSITLITGMGGQLSLAQGALAGVGGFMAAQLANHLGFSLLVGGVIGAVAAAAAAVVLAVLSLRLRGLGLALMTLAGALLFDTIMGQQQSLGGGESGVEPGTPAQMSTWAKPFNLFNPNGHALFIMSFLVLVVVTVAVLAVRRGSVGRMLGAMRGSEVGAAGIGIDLTWQRILIFALSGAVAGIGGTVWVLQQQQANTSSFNYQIGLGFVVIVVTTGVGTVEGAMQGAFGYVILTKLLGYAPARFNDLTFVLFAFGALTYSAHPEGILEYQKRRWMQRFEPLTERLFSHSGSGPSSPTVQLGEE